MDNMHDFLGPLCAFGSSVTWALGSAKYSQFTLTSTAFAVNFTRALIALPLFVIAAFVMAGGWEAGFAEFFRVEPSHWGWFSLSMIASYGVGDVLFFWSTASMGVPGALAIASCYPIWTALAGYFFKSESMSFVQVIGLLVTIGGMVTVILNSPQELKRYRISFRGVGMALATSGFWALNTYSVSHVGEQLTPAVGNTLRMILGLLICGGLGLVLAKRRPLVMPFKEIRRSFWVFPVEAFGGSMLFVYGLGHSPMAIGSTLSSLAPVLSVPIAWLLRLEKFSLYRTLGVCFTVLGLWLLVSGPVF